MAKSNRTDKATDKLLSIGNDCMKQMNGLTLPEIKYIIVYLTTEAERKVKLQYP